MGHAFEQGVAAPYIISHVWTCSALNRLLGNQDQAEVRPGLPRAEHSGGKYRITANFPCRPKRYKQVVGKTDMGDEVTQTMLVCSQGDVTYSVSAVEYPEQAIKSMPADAWLERSLDGLRSQPQYTLKTSARQAHQAFPAILTHFLDSREPPIDLARLFVMTDAGMIVIGASWPSGSPEPSRATSFTDSLSIGEK